MGLKSIFVSSMAGFVFCILISCNPTPPPDSDDSSSTRPNIVLIMADDMGIECMNYFGNTEYSSPRITELATRSVRFDKCYAQPLCTPSRVKIMTGKYNFRNYEDFGWLNPNEFTFGNLLKEAGYSTAVAGKWQLNGLNMNNPGHQDMDRPHHFGFDEYSLWQLHHKRSDGERFADALITQNGQDLPRDQNAYGPDIFTNFICDFISRKTGEPFFVYYPMVLIHDPFVPTPDSPEWQDADRRYEDDTAYVADMVAYVDKIVAKIEDCLKEKDLLENTVLIFTGDNGTRQGVWSKTDRGIVEGGKGKTINAGIHVPMLISWPTYTSEGRIWDYPIDFADIFPTLADLAGVDPSKYATDGISLKKVITGTGEVSKREVFMHYAPRWGKPGEKYGRKSDHTRFVTDGTYKLYQDGNFYNTSIDPLELEPIKQPTNPEIATQQRFDKILKEKEAEHPFVWNHLEFVQKPNR